MSEKRKIEDGGPAEDVEVESHKNDDEAERSTKRARVEDADNSQQKNDSSIEKKLKEQSATQKEEEEEKTNEDKAEDSQEAGAESAQSESKRTTQTSEAQDDQEKSRVEDASSVDEEGKTESRTGFGGFGSLAQSGSGSGFAAFAASNGPPSSTNGTSSSSKDAASAEKDSDSAQGDKEISSSAFGGGFSGFGSQNTSFKGFGGFGNAGSTFGTSFGSFGSANQPGATSSTSLFGAFGSGSSSGILSSSGNEADKQTSSNGRLGSADGENKKIELPEVNVSNGEEGEAIVEQIRGKLFKLITSDGGSETTWTERGIGPARILKPEGGAQPAAQARDGHDESTKEAQEEKPSVYRGRLVMRRESHPGGHGTKLILNILFGTHTKLARSGDRAVRITTIEQSEDGKPQPTTYLLRVEKNDKTEDFIQELISNDLSQSESSV